MALPAVIAYKEKGNIAKLAVYGIAGIAIIYFGYKVYKQIKKFGASLEAIKEGVKEGIEEIKQYGFTKSLKPSDTAEIITKRASKDSTKPYLVDETIYNALKEQGYSLPKNVKPYSLEKSMKESKVKVERETPTIGGKLGLWMSKEEEKEEVKPTYKTNEEIMAIEGKRWQAYANYYKRRRPASPLPEQLRG